MKFPWGRCFFLVPLMWGELLGVSAAWKKNGSVIFASTDAGEEKYVAVWTIDKNGLVGKIEEDEEDGSTRTLWHWLAQKSGWSWHTPDGLQSTPSWLFLRVFLFCAFSCFPRLRRSPNFSSFFHLINRCGISIKVQCQDQVRWTQQIWSRGWWVPLLQLQGLDVCEAADHLRAAGLADGHRQADRGNGLRHRCAAGFWSGHVEHWGGTQAQHVGDASGQITNVSLIRSLDNFRYLKIALSLSHYSAGGPWPAAGD